ncbi:succinic semialdehyde dehydrogenase [Nocardia sp. SSK8]|uniref:succinic semialdehyde dehydrogenase n=1 Tax=Nocardia sp. SSK8 TaxID=3120154 RepID=UPI00300A768B
MPTPPPHVFERLRRLAAIDEPDQRAHATLTEVFTGADLARIPIGTAVDVERAFARARAAQVEWARRPATDRAAVVDRYRRAVVAQRALLMDIAQAETGKSRPAAQEDVVALLLGARYYVKAGPKLIAPKPVAGLLPGLTKTVVRYQPKGVVGIISPWNYPMALSVGDAIPALIAGNAVVIKPDSQTPYCTLALAELLYEAGLPREVLAVVPGPGSVVGTAIADTCDYLMFTGSSATGRTLARAAGARLIGFSAELGGKNPMIVTRTADLDIVAQAATRACFANSGQLCISIERVYVESAVAAEFTEKFAAATRAMVVGPGYDWGTTMGSLASPGRVDAVDAHVADAVAKGATVVAGGRRRPDLGPSFYEPTVLTGVTEEMTVAREETFGPVVSIYPVADVDEAVTRANDSEYGLNASVWAGSHAEGEAIGARLRCGLVNVGEGYGPASGSVEAPMGGMRASGLGRRHGPEGILKYTEAQTIATQRVLTLDAPFGIPEAWWQKAFTPIVAAIGFLPGR